MWIFRVMLPWEPQCFLPLAAGAIAAIAAPIAAQVFGQISGQEGAKDANEQQRNEFFSNQQFTERMSSTAYQRAVIDMQRAGLNPMLAYSQGGASTPGQGPIPAAINAGSAGVSSGAQAAGISKELSLFQSQKANLDAQTANTEAETAIKSLQGQLLAAQTRRELSTAAQTEQQTGQRGEAFPYEFKKLQQSIAESAYNETYYTRLYNRIPELVRAEVEGKVGSAATIAQKYEQLQIMFPQVLRKLVAEADIQQARVHGEVNAGQAQLKYKDYFQNIHPFVHDIGVAGSSASQLLRSIPGLRGY